MADIALAGMFSTKQPQLLPHKKRRILRDAFAAELSALRTDSGYKNDMRGFAVKARVSMTTLHALESGRETDKHITQLTLYNIARGHSAQIIIEPDPILGISEEFHCGATTTLEELWSMGMRATFFRD